MGGGTTTVTGCTITGNAAASTGSTSMGGGVYVSGTGTLNLNTTTVKNNTAPDGAGLLHERRHVECAEQHHVRRTPQRQPAAVYACRAAR